MQWWIVFWVCVECSANAGRFYFSHAAVSGGGSLPVLVLRLVRTLAQAAKTIAATYDLPEQLALGGGHVAAVATENEKVQYSERGLQDHVGGNVEIQMPNLVDPPNDGGNHVEQMRRHEGQRVHNARVGNGPGHAMGP